MKAKILNALRYLYITFLLSISTITVYLIYVKSNWVSAAGIAFYYIMVTILAIPTFSKKAWLEEDNEYKRK